MGCRQRKRQLVGRSTDSREWTYECHRKTEGRNVRVGNCCRGEDGLPGGTVHPI